MIRIDETNIKHERKHLIKSNQYSKMPKQKSQQSIKQRSLDDIHLRKNQLGLKYISKNEKNVKKKQKIKNIKRDSKENKKLNSMYKLNKKDGIIPKQPKEKKSLKNKQTKTNNKNQEKALKITSRTRSQESIQIPNPYHNVQQQLQSLDRKHLNLTEESEISTNQKLKINNTCINSLRTRNITLNQQVFRIFQQTESKLVQQENITLKQFEQVQSYYNQLCDLSTLQQNRFIRITQLILMSNSIKKSLKNIKIWKWHYLVILLIGLIKELDEENILNLKNLLAYVKINYILYVQNFLQLVKNNNKGLNQKIKEFLLKNNKKSTKESQRFQKINRNIDIIRSIIYLVISMTPLQSLIIDLMKEHNEELFVKNFFEIWRNNSYCPYLPPINLQFSYTLCLYLDQTLIFYNQNTKKIQIRPFLSQFLDKVSKDFELVILTSSLKQYADVIIKELDPNNLISYRLYRQNCTIINNKQRKDLAKLGRDLSKTFIVDNLQDNYELQPQSGLTISSWFGQSNDKGLIELLPKLYKIIEQTK